MSQELLQGLGSIKNDSSSIILTNNYLLITGHVWPSAVE